SFGVREEATERRRAVPLVGRPIRLKVVDPNFARRVHVPARLGEDRRHMARRALCLSVEEELPALRSLRVETSRRRNRCGDGQLIEMGAGSLEVTRSGSFLTWPKPAFAATGDGEESFNRESRNVPLPCISRTATNAFQCVTELHPVHVWRLTPAS